MGGRNPYLSIVIPAYNELERLPATLARIAEYLTQGNLGDYELVVIDDGSTDGTLEFAQAYAGQHPEITVRSNGANRGKGYAVRHGLLTAQGEILLFSDSDLSTPIEEAAKLVGRLKQGFDVVIASRSVPEAALLKPQPLYRRLMGLIFRWAVWLLTGLRYYDTQCGFKALTRRSAAIIAPRLTIPGFGFDVELLWLARRFKLRVAEVGVVWINDPRSRVRPLRDSWRMFADLIRIRLRDLRGRYQ